MEKYLFLFFTAFCCFNLDVQAKVIQTQYIKDVIPLIDEDTWFLVDLDNCFF